MKKNIPQIALFIVGVILTVSSCKKEEDKKSKPVLGPATFSENSVIIENDKWQSSVISIDTLGGVFTFSVNPGLNIGDIMISGAGEGFIRKVTNIENSSNNVIIYTEFASLCDAVENVSAHTSRKILPDKKSGPVIMEKGVTLSNYKNNDNSNLHFDIDWIVYDKDGNFNTDNDQITLSGNYGMSSELEANINIQNFDLKEFMLKYSITESTNISVASSLNLSLFEKERKLVQYKFVPFSLFPGCIITPILELYAGVEITNTGEIGLQVDKSKVYVATVAFDNGNWSTNKSIEENETSFDPILDNTLTAKAYLKPKLLLKINGVISPKLEAELYNQLEATASLQGIDWEISKGFTMGIGIEMKILKKTLLDYNANFFDIKAIIAQGNISTIGIPQVESNAVSNISQTTATCGGNVISDGGAYVTERGICWSTFINPTIDDNIISAGSGTGSFNSNISGLNPNTPYHVRAFAKNNKGYGYGEDKPFTTQSEIPSGNLFAYYPFSGNAQDESGNGYNGTVQGATLTTDRHGNSNNAYAFNSNYIEIPSNALNNMPKGTVTAFIYLNNLGVQHSILDKTITTSINYFQFIVDNNNKLRAIINTNGGSFRGNTALSANQWYHVAVTWDGTNITLYLNGIQDGSYANTKGIPNADRHTYIGKVENNTAYMKGKIDEIRIYNKALSQSEIQSLANQ